MIHPNNFKPITADHFIDPLAEAKVKDPNHVILIESSPEFDFHRTSALHGRSMEDPNEYVLREGPLTDEFGNNYQVFSIKGADASLPTASYSDIDPSYVRVHGMLDASTFYRCQKASVILREAGVLTEWPFFHARPKLFPDGERDIGLSPFKKMIYDNYLERVEYKKSLAIEPPSIGQVGLVGQGIVDMQFGVMYRGMLSNVRLQESKISISPIERAQQVAAAITALQARKPEQFTVWSVIADLDPQSPQDHETYLLEVLPQLIGENLGRLHNAGCYHKYVHPGNITLAGEIVDLDSVLSEKIATEDAAHITTAVRIDELFHTSRALQRIIGVTPGDLAGMRPMYQHFFHGYYEQRMLDPNLSATEVIILEGSFRDFDIAPEPGLPQVITRRDILTSVEYFKLFNKALKNIVDTRPPEEMIAAMP